MERQEANTSKKLLEDEDNFLIHTLNIVPERDGNTIELEPLDLAELPEEDKREPNFMIFRAVAIVFLIHVLISAIMTTLIFSERKKPTLLKQYGFAIFTGLASVTIVFFLWLFKSRNYPIILVLILRSVWYGFFGYTLATIDAVIIRAGGQAVFVDSFLIFSINISIVCVAINCGMPPTFNRLTIMQSLISGFAWLVMVGSLGFDNSYFGVVFVVYVWIMFLSYKIAVGLKNKAITYYLSFANHILTVGP